MSNPVRIVDAIQGEIIHEYDGILEADNHLPTWWLWSFFGTIVFAIGYWFWYEEFEVSPGLNQAYLLEKAAEQEKVGEDPKAEELLAQLGTEAVALGAQLFATNCVACHEANGQGKIGPNLTDARWLHGGTPVDIYKTVRDGVSSRGMPPWGQALGRVSVQQLTAFVLSIRDTNVPGKAPEGEPVAEAVAEPVPAEAPPVEPVR